MLMLKPLGWQSLLVHSPLGQQSVLGGAIPLGTTSETIAQTFPILQLALEHPQAESDQSVEWSDWDWDSSSEPNNTALPSSAATSESSSQPAPSAESSTLQTSSSQASSVTESQAQSIADPSFTNSFENSSQDLSQDSLDQSLAIFELLHPQITRKPLGADSSLGYREPLEPIEPTVEADFPFYTAEPAAPAESSIQRSYEEPTAPALSSPALSSEILESSAPESGVEAGTEPEITEPLPAATEGVLSRSRQELSQPEPVIARSTAETPLEVETGSRAETEPVALQPDDRTVLSETDSQFSTSSTTISTQPNQESDDFSTLSRSIEETTVSTSSTAASETDQPSNQAASAENPDLADLASLADSARPSEPSALPLDSPPSPSTTEPTLSATADSTIPSAITTDSTVRPDSLTDSPTETPTPATERSALTDSADSAQAVTPVESLEVDTKESVQLAAKSIANRTNKPIFEPTTESNSEPNAPNETNPNLNLRTDSVSASVDEYVAQSRPVADDRSFTSSDLAVDSSDAISRADQETRVLPETAPESTSETAPELVPESNNPVQDIAPAQLSFSERIDQSSIQLVSESVDEQINRSISEQTAELPSEEIRAAEVNSVSDAGVDAVTSNADEFSDQSIDASETATQPVANIQTNDLASLHQIQSAPIENDLTSENSLTSDAPSPTVQPESSEQASPLPQAASDELQHSPIEDAQLQSIETTASEQTPDQHKVSLPDESLSQPPSVQTKLDSDPSEILDPQNRVDHVASAQSDQANERTSVEASNSEPANLSANVQTSIETNRHRSAPESINPQTDVPETTQSSQDIAQLDRNQSQTDAFQSAQPTPDSWSNLSELIATDSTQSEPWQETLDSLNDIAQPDTQPDLQSEASPLEPQNRADADEQTVIQTRIDPPAAAESPDTVLDAGPDSKPDSKPAPQSPTDEQLDQIAIIIYSQLRQQFEIDRERQGQFLGGYALWLGDVIVAERAGAKISNSSTQKSKKDEIDLMLPNAALDKLTAEIYALLKRRVELDRERNSLYF